MTFAGKFFPFVSNGHGSDRLVDCLSFLTVRMCEIVQVLEVRNLIRWIRARQTVPNAEWSVELDCHFRTVKRKGHELVSPKWGVNGRSSPLQKRQDSELSWAQATAATVPAVVRCLWIVMENVINGRRLADTAAYWEKEPPRIDGGDDKRKEEERKKAALPSIGEEAKDRTLATKEEVVELVEATARALCYFPLFCQERMAEEEKEGTKAKRGDREPEETGEKEVVDETGEKEEVPRFDTHFSFTYEPLGMKEMKPADPLLRVAEVALLAAETMIETDTKPEMIRWIFHNCFHRSHRCPFEVLSPGVVLSTEHFTAIDLLRAVRYLLRRDRGFDRSSYTLSHFALLCHLTRCIPAYYHHRGSSGVEVLHEAWKREKRRIACSRRALGLNASGSRELAYKSLRGALVILLDYHVPLRELRQVPFEITSDRL